MCGICGFSDSNVAEEHSVLQAMNDAIIRRGPDEQGLYITSGVGLAMRRLAIIGIDDGQQPIWNEDRSIVTVFNGEIYNYRELRQELLQKGHTFTTHSDTEVIVHLFEEYGESFVQKLRGMFAIALWDESQQKLFLYRDRFGIKPLFYSMDGSRLYFASEIKSILVAKSSGYTLDLQALEEYLTYTFIPAPKTIYTEIKKLLPGYMATYTASNGELNIQQYYDLNDNLHRQSKLTESDIHQELQESISAHLVSDVPIGLFLSGGVDSGLVGAIASKNGAQKIQSYTAEFSGARQHIESEVPYAVEVSRKNNLELESFVVEPKLDGLLEEICDAFDEPFADDSVVPSYYISQRAAEKLKVILSGLGGDELFSGYNRHSGIVLAAKFSGLPRWLIRPIAAIIERLPEPKNGGDFVDHLKRFVRQLGTPLGETYQSYLSSLDNVRKKDLYSKGFLSQISFEETASVVTKHFSTSKDPLQSALITDLSFYLPDDILALSDRLSMWHSLEIRVPFIDHFLVEKAMSVDSHEKLRRGKKKLMLKKIARSYLPDGVIDHKKQGFEAPMAGWIKSDLRSLYERELSESSIQLHGLFNSEYVQQLLEDHIADRSKNNKILFSILMFQIWYKKNSWRLTTGKGGEV